jgi:hypothetical protein
LTDGALLGIAALIPQDPVFKPGATRVLGDAIGALRSGPLRDVRTSFEIVAMAGRRSMFEHDGDYMIVQLNDGIRAGAFAVVAGVKLLNDAPPQPGVYLPDEALTLDAVIDAMRELDPSGLSIRVSRVNRG